MLFIWSGLILWCCDWVVFGRFLKYQILDSYSKVFFATNIVGPSTTSNLLVVLRFKFSDAWLFILAHQIFWSRLFSVLAARHPLKFFSVMHDFSYWLTSPLVLLSGLTDWTCLPLFFHGDYIYRGWSTFLWWSTLPFENLRSVYPFQFSLCIRSFCYVCKPSS